MVGVILAAGDGRRLKESGKEDCCKPLVKTNRKRLIEYSLDNLLELGVTDAYIVVGKEGNLIKDVLGNKYGKIKLFYIVQKEQKGLIHAFRQAVKVIGCDTTVILQLSDEIFIDLKHIKIKECMKSCDADFYCGVTFEDDVQKIRNNFSVETDSDFIIRHCTEKPEKVINNIKGTGLCIFKSEALAILNDKRELYDLCDYLNYLVQKNKKGLALCVAEKEFNVNNFSDLFEVQNYLNTD